MLIKITDGERFDPFLYAKFLQIRKGMSPKHSTLMAIGFMDGLMRKAGI